MLRTSCRNGLLAVALALSCVGGAGAAVQSHTVTQYLEYCGGCHGVEGRSNRTYIPVLRDQVGVFTCSAEGRAYLGRIPGVSMSLIRDDQDLANVLNFVLFRLGGASTPPGTKPYTAAEVHALRGQALDTRDLMGFRAGVLGRALPQCPPR